MKTGKLVKDRKNHNIFSYDGKDYKYDDIYNLIKDLDYHKSGIDCDWNIIRIHDIKDDRDCYALVFQETTSKTDWKEDFKFFPQPVKAYKGWKHKLIYHKGFYEEYQSARDEIKSYLSPLLQDLANEQNCLIEDLKMYVFGWSLGGSIVPIAVEDIYETYSIKSVALIYEGANPCESYHTKKYVQSCFDEESIAFVYSNDIVPRVPCLLGWELKDYIYYLNDHKCKFPFYFIKKLISFIKDTEYYHCNVDIGIQKFMPLE